MLFLLVALYNAAFCHEQYFFLFDFDFSGIIFGAFRAFSERVLSSRALALDFTRVLNLTRVATLSKASLSMVMAFMSIDCDSLSSLPPLSSSRVPNFYTL